MKVLIVQDELFDYLKHVVNSYAAAGIAPNEGLALYRLDLAIQGAQTVSDSQVAKIATGEVAGVPISTVAVSEDANIQ